MTLDGAAQAAPSFPLKQWKNKMTDLEYILQAASILAFAKRKELNALKAMLEAHMGDGASATVGDDLAYAWIENELDACE